MKVLILTIQKAPSYGACLQNYALYKFICSLGHYCQVIDLARPYHNDYIPSKRFPVPVRPYYSLKSLIKGVLLSPKAFINRRIASFHSKNIKDSKTAQSSVPVNENLLEIQKKNFESFEGLISYTKRYSSIQELYNNPPEADVFITGSDQAWNPTQPWCMEPYFLTFVKGKAKKITYATSIGLTSISDYVSPWYKKWLKKLDTVSVREQAGIDILKKISDKPIFKCCDPTFLISKQDWLKIATPTNIKDKYVYVFLLYGKKELIEKARVFASANHLIVVVQCHKHFVPQDNDYSDVHYIYEAGPLEFISLIKNAELVFTDSFHGTVFSLIMNTPFRVCINDERRSSRITDLLEELKAQSCLITSEDNLYMADIDFSLVNDEIIRLSDLGKKYLSDSIL